VPGEHLLLVPPLPTPAETGSPERLLDCPSVRLFVDRAQAVRPSFQLTEGNAAAVAALCQGLEGLPLALELAAARVDVLTPPQMLARLEQRFEMLTDQQRRVEPRHQSLRAALDWSYQLLPPEVRQFFARLSVFRGGWTLEAAEAVCGEPEALDYLSALTSASLVVAEEIDEEMRYRLLETVRQYARERLLEAGEGEMVRERHRDWFLKLAEGAEPRLRSGQMGVWLDRLERELDNLRVAVEWGLKTDPASALRLAGALGLFWDVRGYYAEGREALERGLERGAVAPGAIRAKALGWAGRLAWFLGETERAKALLEESRDLSRELRDPQGVAFALNFLGLLAYGQADYEAARPLFEESLALSRELGDKWGIAFSLSNLAGIARSSGDSAAVRSLLTESLALQRQIGDRRGMGWSLRGFGWAAQQQGDLDGARAFFAESLAIDREIGHKRGIAYSLGDLANLAQEQGDPQAARVYGAESLALQQELDSPQLSVWGLRLLGWLAQEQGDYRAARTLVSELLARARDAGDSVHCAYALRKLGEVAVAQAEPERAARLFGAAEALRDAIATLIPSEEEQAGRQEGGRLPVSRIVAPIPTEEEQAAYERRVADARASLDEKTFTAAWAEGQAMSLMDVIAEALQAAPAG
jgi:tetratricopeptide (TPR) repeat protein